MLQKKNSHNTCTEILQHQNIIQYTQKQYTCNMVLYCHP